MIYVIILLLLLILGYNDVSCRIAKSQKKKIFISVALFFWILSFIRWQTGTDWDSYQYFFDRFYTYEDFRDEGGFELFYAGLSYLVKTMTSSYTLFLFVVALIIFPLTYSTIFRYSPFPFVALLVYLLLRRADIFFVRESIAIAFCFFSTRYIVQRRVIHFILCVILGMQFHSSVIVFLPAYWLYDLKIELNKIYIALIVFSIFSLFLSSYIANYFGDFAMLLGGSFEERADKYMERGFDSGGASSMTSALVQGTINRLVFFYFYAKYYVTHTNDTVYRGFLNLYVFSMVIFLLLTPFSLTLGRLVNSYEMFSILLIGPVFSTLAKQKRLACFILFYCYITLRFVVGTLYGVYSEAFIPFKTIFD